MTALENIIDELKSRSSTVEGIAEGLLPHESAELESLKNIPSLNKLG